MEPDQSSTTHPYRGALWLNGALWVLLLALRAYPLLALLASGAGVLLNLGTGLWRYAAEQRRAAYYYLLGAVPLGLLWWWLHQTLPGFVM